MFTDRVKRLAVSYDTSLELIKAIEAITASRFTESVLLSPATKLWHEGATSKEHDMIVEYLDRVYPDWEYSSFLWWGAEKFYRCRGTRKK
jgi:hypothetical protein